ncbi:CDP-diacylglycerol--glycerol-3-phosphate 3-phosphatidyltransferase [Mycoplasmatota bacterium WC44]
MNLPNRLTMLRILFIPVIVIIYYIPSLDKELFFGTSAKYLLIVLIFALASITDFLDGYFARKLNLITTFGKFIDPLADKLLVSAALLLLVDAELVSTWIVIVILSREFIVSGIRLIASIEGKVIAAGKLGKYKTFSTMIAIMLLFISPLYMFGHYLMILALVLTILSGYDYVYKNKEIILSSK